MSDHGWPDIPEEGLIFFFFLLNFIWFYFDSLLSYNVRWIVFEQSYSLTVFCDIAIEHKNHTFVNLQLCILSTLIQTVFTISKLYLWLIAIAVGAVMGLDAALPDVCFMKCAKNFFKSLITWPMDSCKLLVLPKKGEPISSPV